MDTFHLDRFVDAQESVYRDVTSELRSGRKRSHWMWFIFPQLKGLGHSPTAQFYGLASLAEAAAYLNHPVLGVRLRECTQLVLDIEHATALQIFGRPDDLKLRSCMTLFMQCDAKSSQFSAALDKYFAGKPDERTLQILAST